MTPRLANLLTGVCLLGLIAGIATTAPRWARYLRQPLLAEREPLPPAASPSAAPALARRAEEAEAEAQKTISVKLFFESADQPGLVAVERPVPFSDDLPRQIRVVLEELIRGPEPPLAAPLAKEAKVLDVFVTARGVAYVDLSKEAGQLDVPGGDAELLSVYSIVNTVAENFPAVRRVQILIDDHPVDTLAGHVDLSRPLAADLPLLAPAPLVEKPEPSAQPSPGAP